MVSCDLSDKGAPHFSAGKVFHACTNFPPQMPAQARPENRKNKSTMEIQDPTARWVDFQKARPLARNCGTNMAEKPSPLRGHAIQRPVTTKSTPRLAAISIR